MRKKSSFPSQTDARRRRAAVEQAEHEFLCSLTHWEEKAKRICNPPPGTDPIAEVAIADDDYERWLDQVDQWLTVLRTVSPNAANYARIRRLVEKAEKIQRPPIGDEQRFVANTPNTVYAYGGVRIGGSADYSVIPGALSRSKEKFSFLLATIAELTGPANTLGIVALRVPPPPRELRPDDLPARLDLAASGGGIAATPEVENGEQQAETLVPLKIPVIDNDERVLRYLLGTHPCLRKQVEIVVGARIARQTASNSLKRLREARLVHQPHGQRKGYVLTDKGVQLARHLRQIHAIAN